MHGELSGLESPEAFGQWLDPVRDIPWVIRCPGIWDCRAAADDPEATLRTVRYLARYVNRIAISNRRLLGIQGNQVLLRYKDYRDGNRWKVKAIDGVQFIRRFLRHIRRCGFMGAVRRKSGPGYAPTSVCPIPRRARRRRPRRPTMPRLR